METPGVTVLNRAKCDDSCTLYSSRQTEVAHLIDVDGNELHRWEHTQGFTWHYAEMLPNGNLVAIIKEEEGRVPGMLIELDWHGSLVWKADVAAHHDVDRLANGNTLAVCREYVVNPTIRVEGDIKSDSILELTPKGEAAWEWHIDRHLDELLAFVPITLPHPERDWAHTNTVESLPDSPAARRDPRFRAGNVLFSSRHIDTIGVIDKATGEVVWAWGPGIIDKQHMPTMLPNGHILVYDNGCAAKRSRVVELDPLAGAIVWQYVADPPASFYSFARGSNERLANGNTFIAESDNGRLFEVTPDGEKVWEFYNPDTMRNGRRQALYRALRYRREQVERLLATHDRTTT